MALPSERELVCLIPANGEGTRFRQAGYAASKPMIRFLGTEMLFWLIDDLVRSKAALRRVVIPYNACMDDEGIRQRILQRYPGLGERMVFVPLHFSTWGATESLVEGLVALLARDPAAGACPLLCLDSDTFYTGGADVCKSFMDSRVDQATSGAVFVFRASDGASDGATPYSHCVLRDSPDACLVEQIQEKVRISEWACSGAYGFPSCATALTSARRLLAAPAPAPGVERYLSHLVHDMMTARSERATFAAIRLGEAQFACLGTPMHLVKAAMACTAALPSGPDVVSVEWPYHRWDVVGGSVSPVPRVTAGDDDEVRGLSMFLSRVKATRRIHVEARAAATPGAFVLLVTDAARMARFKADARSFMNARLGEQRLLDAVQLTSQEVVHDPARALELVPQCRYASMAPVSARLDTACGFLTGQHTPCRHFHQIVMEPGTGRVIKRATGPDASAHLAHQARFLAEAATAPWGRHFPELLAPDPADVLIAPPARLAEYAMRQVRGGGATFAYLFRHQLLECGTLRAALAALREMHACTPDDAAARAALRGRMYDNYARKLLERSHKHAALYNDIMDAQSHEMLAQCVEYLRNYQAGEMGCLGCIHGDAVFSNIMVDADGACVFIDPRAQLGHAYSPYGDVIYDYAKLLQSLMGYDEVIAGTQVPSAYRNQMLDVLFDAIEAQHGRAYLDCVRCVCCSLYVSLLPLHDNAAHREAFLRIARHVWLQRLHCH